MRQRRTGASTGAAKATSGATQTRNTTRRGCCSVCCSLLGNFVAVIVAALALSAGWAAYDNVSSPTAPFEQKPSLNLWRAISTLSGGLESIGLLKLGDKSLEELVEHAESTTGLSDWGGELHAKAAFDNLQRVKTSLEASPGISTVLKLVVREMVMIESLVKRLKIVDLLKRMPEIEKVPVRNPIMLIGSWRTGSTFLHNLLAEDATARKSYNFTEI